MTCDPAATEGKAVDVGYLFVARVKGKRAITEANEEDRKRKSVE
jgi:hypothetical protein